MSKSCNHYSNHDHDGRLKPTVWPHKRVTSLLTKNEAAALATFIPRLLKNLIPSAPTHLKRIVVQPGLRHMFPKDEVIEPSGVCQGLEPILTTTCKDKFSMNVAKMIERDAGERPCTANGGIEASRTDTRLSRDRSTDTGFLQWRALREEVSAMAL